MINNLISLIWKKHKKKPLNTLNLVSNMTHQIEAGSVLFLGGDDAHDNAEDAAQNAGNPVEVQHAARVMQSVTRKIFNMLQSDSRLFVFVTTG